MSEFKRKCKKWAAGFLGLYFDLRLKKKRKKRALDIIFVDFLLGRLFRKPYSSALKSDDLHEYIERSKEAAYWHGTGRLQYDKKGEIVDVLERILTQGSIQPFTDLFDFKHGEMKSISVARQRMYGRIYADMHQYQGVDLRLRYGSPSFWTYYFIVAVNLHATKELGLWNPKVRRQKHDQWRQQAKELWTVKITRDPAEKAGTFFTQGSDIKDNFPILIGVRRDSYEMHKTAGYIARYESRIASKIPIHDFTHLEVPEEKRQGIKMLLEKHGHKDIPVFAIEKVERFYADKYFSELVR